VLNGLARQVRRDVQPTPTCAAAAAAEELSAEDLRSAGAVAAEALGPICARLGSLDTLPSWASLRLPQPQHTSFAGKRARRANRPELGALVAGRCCLAAA
jgi:hypothetical protein